MKNPPIVKKMPPIKKTHFQISFTYLPPIAPNWKKYSQLKKKYFQIPPTHLPPIILKLSPKFFNLPTILL